MAARDSKIVIDADLSLSPALGDRVLLEGLAANLLDNAATPLQQGLDKPHA